MKTENANNTATGGEAGWSATETHTCHAAQRTISCVGEYSARALAACERGRALVGADRQRAGRQNEEVRLQPHHHRLGRSYGGSPSLWMIYCPHAGPFFTYYSCT